MTDKKNSEEVGAEETKTKVYRLISKEKKDSKLTLEIEIPYSLLEAQKTNAIKALGKDLEIKGFRKGSAPSNIIEENIGASKIVEEMGYQAIIKYLPQIVDDEKINSLTQPQISVLKIAPQNPMIFKAEFILMPEIKIADYKKIAKSVKQTPKVEVTDTEINDYIDYIKNSKAEAEKIKKQTSADPKERNDSKKEDLVKVEFNDDFVKTLGDFKDVDDFKTKLKANMLEEKQVKENQKRRLEIVEKIINESEIELPDILIEEELGRMLAQFKDDITRAKMDFSDYLKQINKTEEDLYKEWRPDAIKRSKMNLILPKIAFAEKIEASDEVVDKEVQHLKSHYPDINDEHARSYVSHILRNEEVFKFLENIK